MGLFKIYCLRRGKVVTLVNPSSYDSERIGEMPSFLTMHMPYSKNGLYTELPTK